MEQTEKQADPQGAKKQGRDGSKKKKYDIL